MMGTFFGKTAIDTLARPAGNAQETTPTQHDDALPLAGRKILIIVENLPVPFDRRVWQEAQSLHAAGAQVCIICPKTAEYSQARQTIDGIYIYRHNLPFEARSAWGFALEYGAALFHQTRLAWLIFFTHGFDTLHACNPPDLIFLVAWPFKLMGKRFVFDHHDITPELFEAKFGKRGLLWHLMVWLERLSFQMADLVISTNQSYRAIALCRGQKKSEQVHVVRSGPDMGRIHPMPADPSLKNNRTHLVCYVGVMGTQEGLDLLLEAIAHLVHRQGITDCHWALIGDGPERSSLRALAQKLDLDPFVSFPGRVCDPLLWRYLSTADICVNPDRANAMNDKSTMNKIMDYMAFGKPIVQFDLTEGRVSAQQASLYARPNDTFDFAHKVALLLNDAPRRTQMGAFGKRRVTHTLAWHLQAPKLINAYRSLEPQ